MVKHKASLAIAFAGASLLFLTTVILITPNSDVHYKRLFLTFRGASELCLARRMQKRLPLTRSATIPARVWQLELETNDKTLSSTASDAMQSWEDINGESLQIVRHDRIAGQALLSDMFGSKMRWALGYLAWPLPQLESLWSLAALYSRGGIFVASNMQCKVPISHWFQDNQESAVLGKVDDSGRLDTAPYGQTSWKDCSLLVAVDDTNPSLFNDQVFASTSGHPVVLAAMEKMVKTLLRQNTLLARALRFNVLPAPLEPQSQSRTHGSTIITDAIRSALKLSKFTDATDIITLVRTDDKVHARARTLRLCFMDSKFLSEQVQMV